MRVTITHTTHAHRHQPRKQNTQHQYSTVQYSTTMKHTAVRTSATSGPPRTKHGRSYPLQRTLRHARVHQPLRRRPRPGVQSGPPGLRPLPGGPQRLARRPRRRRRHKGPRGLTPAAARFRHPALVPGARGGSGGAALATLSPVLLSVAGSFGVRGGDRSGGRCCCAARLGSPPHRAAAAAATAAGPGFLRLERLLAQAASFRGIASPGQLESDRELGVL